ncbi:MAG: cyclic-di-AMP receptor [Anaerolineaceae bacterium]
MKLILLIIQDTDYDVVSTPLISGGFRVTCIASTGGFWKKGNKTLLIGLEDKEVQNALNLIKTSFTDKEEPEIGRATIFVLNVADFVRF